MNRKLFYLKRLNLFKTLPAKDIRMISEKFGEKEYGKREVILEPEDHGKIFILKAGRLEIYQLTLDGKKIIIDVLGPGDVFGDLGFEGAVENFVEATTNSFVCTMRKEEFFDMIAKNQKISTILIKELFSRITESEKQVAALASANLLSKVKNLLLRLVKKHGIKKDNQAVITTKFTHEQLAEMIGISRPTMTELLSKLEKKDLIARKGKIISFNLQKISEL